MGRTAVVTDSTALPLPPGGRQAAVVPLDVVVADRARAETGLPMAELLDALRSGVPVSTSRPSPDGFARAYAAARDAGASAVVSVHLSGALSGTASAAAFAAASAPLRVEVVDTRTAGAPLTAAVSAAVHAAERGEDARSVAAAARRAARASWLWVSPSATGALERGGRLAGSVASALAVRPLLVLEEGALVPVERVRTTARLLARLSALARDVTTDDPGVEPRVARRGTGGMRTHDASHVLVVQHVGAADAAAELVARLVADGVVGRGDGVDVRQLGPVLSAHLGPGALGLAVVPRLSAQGVDRA